MLTIVGECKAGITPIYIPTDMAADELSLRQYLESLAKEDYKGHPVCFWMKLSAGRMKAYFWAFNGMESRTYSSIEITDVLFSKKALFFHSIDSILNQLEAEEAVLMAA